MTDTSTSKRWPGSVAVTTIAIALVLPGCGATPTEPIHAARAAQVVTTTSRATRLREFRHMIVGLYRVPGAERPGEDPLDALWRSLATQYGPVARPDTRSGAAA